MEIQRTLSEVTFEDKNKASNNNKKDKKIVLFLMKYHPSVHNKLKKKENKESKIWHLIRNIQRTAPLQLHAGLSVSFRNGW